jgi:hypothetical protein
MKSTIKNENKYVVVRNGVRVSDVEYDTDNCAKIKNEYDFWKRVIKNWSAGDTLEIVKKENKHRVYNLK